MVELDLPTLQLQRYVDLLKRRRWQLIPFAIVGLLVGGVIAALIPRYYEAKTEVRLVRTVLDRNQADEMLLQEVENASSTIKSPAFLQEVIEELGWPEFFPLGPWSWEALAETADRITVKDMNPARGRNSARLLVGYRDRVAVRAKELTDKLLEVYVRKEMDNLKYRAGVELKKAFDDVTQAIRDINELREDLADFDRDLGITPVRSAMGGKKDTLDVKSERLGELRKEIDELKAKEESLKARIANLQKVIELTPDKIAASLDPNSQLVQAAGSWWFKADLARKTLAGMQPTHPDYAARQAELHLAEESLRQLLEVVKNTHGLEAPNPVHAGLLVQRLALEDELTGVKAGLAERQKQEEPLKKEVDAIPALRTVRETLEAKIDATESRRKNLQEAHDRKSGEWSSLLASQESAAKPIPAYLPREPTYPNIWIVASAGCLIGLFAAVGLVFLLDFLRSTFKTVDDAARGLAVPVLGFVSHMDTPEVQAALRRRRLGWSAAAAALVILSGSIVVLYNVDKTRLPVFVHRVLDSVLGSRK